MHPVHSRDAGADTGQMLQHVPREGGPDSERGQTLDACASGMLGQLLSAKETDPEPPEVPGVAAGACASGMLGQLLSAKETHSEPPEVPGVAAGACASGMLGQLLSAKETHSEPPEVPGVAAGACASGMLGQLLSAKETDSEPVPAPADDASAILTRVWGFSTLKPAQQEVVDFITARTSTAPDLICNFPTGFGKTVCYCLPVLHERVRVLVVSPLCSLISDQTAKLNARAGARVALNLSGMGPAEDAQLAGATCDHGRLLFTTPERLQGEDFAASLAQAHARDPLAYIVLDEAHLVVEQGYTFRPDYLRLGSLRAAFPGVPIYCFSATCTAYVRQDLEALLRLRTPRHFAVPDARDNLHLCVHHTRKGARQCACGDAACMWPVYAHAPDAGGPCVARCVRGLSPGEALVFAATVREVEALHAHLQQRLPTASIGLYHGKLADEERLQTQARFVGGELDVLVATMASFGTGVDMPRVSRVVICGVPGSVHTLVQTVGRGGRGAANAARPYLVDVFVTEAQVAKNRAVLQNELRQARDAGYARYMQESLELVEQFVRLAAAGAGPRACLARFLAGADAAAGTALRVPFAALAEFKAANRRAAPADRARWDPARRLWLLPPGAANVHVRPWAPARAAVGAEAEAPAGCMRCSACRRVAPVAVAPGAAGAKRARR